MPRVANSSRSQNGPNPSTANALRIPLNDDRQEKAMRLQSRQALHDLQMHKIRAAASPMRRNQDRERSGSTGPATPQGMQGQPQDSLDNLFPAVAGTSMTPMKRMPILANFEEWMKMATDNKINATNSWNFALIDYFHDMSLLKEGDGVNFQKASCTLDGCVKIYTSRVDSVATETGKLLSGLTEGDGKKGRSNTTDEAGDDAMDGDEGGENNEGRRRKKTQRSSEATLATSFAPLQLKKFELEFAVDPLFKKASADFDEGGARGLLLNNLAIDTSGRLAFDSSDNDDSADIDGHKKGPGGVEDSVDLSHVVADADLDSGSLRTSILSLGTKFFPDLEDVEAQVLCPSLHNFDLGDPSSLPQSISQLSGASAATRNGSGIGSGPVEFREGGELDSDDVAAAGLAEAGLTYGEEPDDIGFGEGGELWATHAAANLGAGVDDARDEAALLDLENLSANLSSRHVTGDCLAVALDFGKRASAYNAMLGYFDNLAEKNWAGPEHWRIRKLRQSTSGKPPLQARRRDKDAYEIDFASTMDDAGLEAVHTFAVSSASISLPKRRLKSANRHLLPDDKHFNSRDLLGLFLKPRALAHSRRRLHGDSGSSNQGQGAWTSEPRKVDPSSAGENEAKGSYDADFFQDDGLGLPHGMPSDDEEEYANALETMAEAPEKPDGAPLPDGTVADVDERSRGFGSQLLIHGRKVKPDYVQFAKSAKKIDVRQLKEEIWKGIATPKVQPSIPRLSPSPDCEVNEAQSRFTAVMKGLQGSYSADAIKDISTSYCFICLLHLANENGLELSNEAGLEELLIDRLN